MTTIAKSVGKGGKNEQSDVDIVRGLLQRHAIWVGTIQNKGPADAQLTNAIMRFQKTAASLARPDGRVDPSGFTLRRLDLANIPGPKHAVFKPLCWNRTSQISEFAYNAAATTLGCEVAAIKAVAEVETRGGPFDHLGRPTILFERHKFRKFTNNQYNRSHADISGPAGGYGASSTQYPKLYRAAMLNEAAALKSTSWGMFQIMGFNHVAAGYSTVVRFVDAMHDTVDKHLDAFVSFINNDVTLKKAIKDKKWATFASGYNGSGYAANKYDTKMKSAYEKHKPKTKP